MTSMVRGTIEAHPGTVLREALLAGANSTGGWGYYAGKASRLEPTCWALLALGSNDRKAAAGVHPQFLERCQQSSGWLVEDPHWPVNIGFNALALFTWLSQPSTMSPVQPANTDARPRLLSALVSSKGVQAPASDLFRQDNSLQGWSWIDETFSWVEPTAWGLIALKKARRAGLGTPAAEARIAEAERLLIDRCCSIGGWNFGNASVMHQDLRPYVPTSALGLLAMQDRRDEPTVARSLAFLEAHWSDEISAPSLGISLLCLEVFGRPVDRVRARLAEHAEAARSFGNLNGDALALYALSHTGAANAFRL